MKIKSLASQTITCLSISERTLKLVQSRQERSARVIFSLKAIPLKDRPDEELTRVLPELLKGQKQKDLGRFIIIIPRQSAALDIVRLPSTRPDEIREMAQLQAAKLLPYEPRSIIVGCQPIRVTPEGYSEVVLIIVHQDIVKKYLKILEKNKLEPQEITIDSQGICSWLKVQRALKIDTPAAVIDLDAYSARLDIIARGISIYSRAFALGLPMEEYKLRLLDEINKSLAAYEKEDIGERPVSAFFTGAERFLEFIDEDFIGKLTFKCIKYPQNQNIPLKAIPVVRQSDLRENSFANVLGMALAIEKPAFNLVPEEMLAKRQRAIAQLQIRKTASLISLIIATIALAMFLNIFEKKRMVRQLNEQLRTVSEEAGRIEQIAKKLQLVRSQLQGQRYSCLEILTEVFRIASGEISLASFGYEVNDVLTLKGQGKTLAEVFNFVNTLEASALFKKVQVRHSSKRKIKNEEVADFEIVCPLEKR